MDNLSRNGQKSVVREKKIIFLKGAISQPLCPSVLLCLVHAHLDKLTEKLYYPVVYVRRGSVSINFFVRPSVLPTMHTAALLLKELHDHI